VTRTLARSGNGPVYEQILRAIAEPIVAGHWRPGRRIPSEMELTKAFKTSRMTVNRALTTLAADGLIVRWRRRGSFVAERAVELSVFEIWDIAAEIARSGRTYGYELLARRSMEADADVASDMDVAPGTPVVALTCRHSADGEIVQLEHRLISLTAVRRAADETFEAVAPGRWLLDHVPWSEAEHTIRAEPADARTAGLMRIARGTACLVIERRTWQSRKAITLARLIHPGARHCLRGRFRLGASSRLRAER
jgi:GntR family histidine utilization transcriptional repressor